MVARRVLVLGGLATVTAAAVGGTVGVAFLKHDFFASMLRRHLPGLALADGEIRKFVDAYWPRFIDRHGRRRARLLILTVRLDQVIPEEADVTEQIERDVITQFLIGSNFFQRADPGSETIAFSELPTICPNPFYRT
ncbi:MAG: hypothetical protein AB7S71_02190 [Dongiaceae bacterium]